MDIADTLRKTIKRRRLSIYQIAKDTGLNQSGLNRFFNGTKAELQLSTIQVSHKICGSSGDYHQHNGNQLRTSHLLHVSIPSRNLRHRREFGAQTGTRRLANGTKQRPLEAP